MLKRSGDMKIDLYHGRFTPGATVENKGRSEIEIFVDSEGDELGKLFVRGTSQPDVFIGGARGMKLNRDDDLDVRTFDQVLRLGVVTEGGDDSAFLDGRSGTGALDYGPTDQQALLGGGGDDVLVGGPTSDNFSGAGGQDTLLGVRGKDSIEGGQGADRLRGGRGNDHLDGSAGRDRCRPGHGHDTKEHCEYS
ncbi:MAG TPA: hypothetical protein VEV82_08335 [Actinomycetota bacterium]|nr:hypothetical protein [Actinomycetota bacterium]